MNIKDNVLKEFLKNVYFITGTPCGGKTTLSRALGKKHDMVVFDIDERFDEHQKMSDCNNQPNMNKVFNSADEFFGRTVKEYKEWLLGNTREQLEFVLLDLIRLSSNQKILCDCHLTVEQALTFSDPSRVVFLIREPSNLADQYCNRPDHDGFRNYLYSASDVEKAKETVNDTLYELNANHIQEIKNSPFFWLERTENSTVEDTINKVEEHLQLSAEVVKE